MNRKWRRELGSKKPERWTRKHATLTTKAKLLWSFFQVSTRAPVVYLLSLPPSVAAVLSALQLGVNLDLTGVSQMLECLGYKGLAPLTQFMRKKEKPGEDSTPHGTPTKRARRAR